MAGDKIILMGLLSDWQSMIDRIYACNKDIHLFYSPEYPEEGKIYPELIGLSEDYNNLISRTLTILTSAESSIVDLSMVNFNNRKIPYERGAYEKEKLVECINNSQASLTLERMKQGAKKATAIIEEMLKNTKISDKEEKELQSLINIINEKMQAIVPLCSMDLKYSIGEFRKGDLLGAILISGRTIDIIYDKLAKMAKDNKKGNTQDEINEFIQANLFGDDKGRGKLAMSGILLYRNKFSHNIGIYPTDETETITIINGCISIITKILDKNLSSSLGLK